MPSNEDRGHKKVPQKRHKTGFRGPSPDVGKKTQFKPGNRANPGGRPKSKLLSEAYKNILQTEIGKGKDAKTYAEAIAEKMAKQAKGGHVNAASEIADRVEGKPRQAYEVKLSIMDELADRLKEGRERLKARKAQEKK
jgi:hypothetical protein